MAMAMTRIERVLVGVHDDREPTDAEWLRWLTLARDPATDTLRLWVETSGFAGPNAKQRKLMHDTLHGVDLRIAVLTDSLVVKGVITAVAWLGLAVRGFGPTSYRDAAHYLGLTSVEVERVMTSLPALRRECAKANE